MSRRRTFTILVGHHGRNRVPILRNFQRRTGEGREGGGGINDGERDRAARRLLVNGTVSELAIDFNYLCT